MPIILTVKDGDRLNNVDIEELKDGKNPSVVVKTINQNRKTKDSGSIYSLVYELNGIERLQFLTMQFQLFVKLFIAYFISKGLDGGEVFQIDL